MSKVICEVCGTTYPDTAAQCPICNSANRAQNTTGAAGEGEENVNNGHEHTKGGRFSRQNVKKRSPRTAAEPRRRDSNQDEDEPNSTGLIVVVILLLIAIVAVLIYIGVNYFQSSTDVPEPTGNGIVVPTEGDPKPTETQGDGMIPCVSIEVRPTIVELLAVNETCTLVINTEPLDTTDKLTFTTSNPNVALVSADGIITAVSGGEAVITATCGNVSASCTVKCSFGQATEPKPTEPKVELKMEWNTRYTDSSTGYADTTLSYFGQSWRAYKSNSLNVNPADIQWTSDDLSICTIVDGVVTAVAPGTTKVHATYGDVTLTAIVRCKWKEEPKPTEPKPTEPAATQPADPEATTDPNATEPTVTEPKPTEPQPTEPPKVYKLNYTDLTLWTEGTGLDKTVTMYLLDENGDPADVVWTASGDGILVEGNKVTAVSAGTFKVTTTHEGKTYTCIFYVHAGAPQRN